MSDSETRKSWCWKHSLATWTFSLPQGEARPSQQALLQHTLSALAALDGFAIVTRVEWVTDSAGDDAAIYEPDEHLDPSQVRATFSRLDDVIDVICDLTLLCTDEHGTPMALKDGATLKLSCSWLNPGSRETDTPDLYLQLRLHTDIYSPVTWGAVRDNRSLAAVNGPRLASFLRRVQQLGATLDEIEASAYVGLADATGFCASASTCA